MFLLMYAAKTSYVDDGTTHWNIYEQYIFTSFESFFLFTLVVFSHELQPVASIKEQATAASQYYPLYSSR